MDKWLYVMFIERSKTYNKMTKAVVTRHVERLRQLDNEGRLERCGVFKGYPGVAGMILLRAESREEAEELCRQEPMVMEGFASYKLYPLQVAERENNYLL